MNSPNQHSPFVKSHHSPNTAQKNEGNQSGAEHQSNNYKFEISHPDHEASSIHTTAAPQLSTEALEIRPSFDADRTRMDHQIDQDYPSATTTTIGSWTDDLKESDEGAVAQRLIQLEIGSHDNIGSDLTVVSKQLQNLPSSHQVDAKSSGPPSEQGVTLPLKRAHPLWRRIRHQLLAVYQRLFSLVLLGNLIAIIILLIFNRDSRPFGPSIGSVASAIAANVTGAVLVRQEFVVNALYDFFCWTPLWMSLRYRRIVAKLYHLGGVHSGCAVSAVMWFILFTALVTRMYAAGDYGAKAVEIAVLCLTYSLLFLFLAITIFAVPRFRVVSHNTFELIHRLGGWLAIALFWVLFILLNHAQSQQPGSQSLGILVVQAPAFWFLLIVTACIILPWLRLRRVPVQAEQLSRHAIRLRFSHIKKVNPVTGIRIATSPLKEWHTFASIPSSNGSSFSLIVSNAGDWTKYQIANPSAHYWVRGIPVAGVLRMAAVFKKIVLVTTGSGIGPALSLALSSARTPETRLLWSTPAPLETYGQDIVNAVTSFDRDAVIWNTRERGRPHMINLAYQLYKECGAEAVFVISNPSLTSKLVYGMEARGVPAFGPIWDS